MTTAGPVAHTPEQDRATATIVAAFITDPVTRWIYPEAAQYLSAMPRIVAAFGGGAFGAETAFATPDHAAVALWLPPGVSPDGETMSAVMSETVPEHLQEDLSGFAEMQSSLHPHDPHWYLPLIGVDPAHQGRGLGSTLLAHVAKLLDEAGQPAYLEATNLNNRRLYERHGFVAVEEIQFGSSPTMYGMLREPR